MGRGAGLERVGARAKEAHVFKVVISWVAALPPVVLEADRFPGGRLEGEQVLLPGLEDLVEAVAGLGRTASAASVLAAFSAAAAAVAPLASFAAAASSAAVGIGGARGLRRRLARREATTAALATAFLSKSVSMGLVASREVADARPEGVVAMGVVK